MHLATSFCKFLLWCELEQELLSVCKMSTNITIVVSHGDLQPGNEVLQFTPISANTQLESPWQWCGSNGSFLSLFLLNGRGFKGQYSPEELFV